MGRSLGDPERPIFARDRVFLERIARDAGARRNINSPLRRWGSELDDLSRDPDELENASII